MLVMDNKCTVPLCENEITMAGWPCCLACARSTVRRMMGYNQEEQIELNAHTEDEIFQHLNYLFNNWESIIKKEWEMIKILGVDYDRDTGEQGSVPLITN